MYVNRSSPGSYLPFIIIFRHVTYSVENRCQITYESISSRLYRGLYPSELVRIHLCQGRVGGGGGADEYKTPLKYLLKLKLSHYTS
jgi:hypothetical protein